MTNCIATMDTVAWMMALSLTLTTLLFFLRVRAIYIDKPCVVGFFFILWIGVCAGCIVETQVGRAATAGDMLTDGYCISNPVNNLSLVTTMATIPLVNDTLSFCAITWRLMQIAEGERTFKKGMKVVVFGRYLPAFTRALLKDGQIYFL